MSAAKKQRTCIICRKQDTKSDFLRVVRSPEGRVDFDPSGKANGRGAYVCSVACFEKAVVSRRFASALRVKLDEEDYKRISDELLSAVSALSDE